MRAVLSLLAIHRRIMISSGIHMLPVHPELWCLVRADLQHLDFIQNPAGFGIQLKIERIQQRNFLTLVGFSV